MKQSQHISGTGPRVIVSFVIALTTIAVATVAGIVMVAIMVENTSEGIILIGVITTFATSVGASVIGLFSLLFQVRGEMNHRFDQLIQAKADLSYNAGLDAVDGADKTKRGVS